MTYPESLTEYLSIEVRHEEPSPGPPIVVYDLDGTLRNTQHRQHLIAKPKEELTDADWSAFFMACSHDLPFPAVIDTLRALAAMGFRIVLLSGASAISREATKDWLDAYGLPWHELIMRQPAVRLYDHELKEMWLLAHPERQRIRMVFEDRDTVVAMWRKHGIPCFQVAPGNF